MKILVVSSKYQPEYSGSGLRAHNTYKRFQKNFNLNFDIVSNSTIYKGNKQYVYDGVDINRISPPFKIPEKKSLWRKILVLFGIFWEVFYSWKFIRKNIDNYSLLHTLVILGQLVFLHGILKKKISQ